VSGWYGWHWESWILDDCGKPGNTGPGDTGSVRDPSWRTVDDSRGSFLDALKVSGVSNLAAALAYQIGDAKLDNAFGDASSRQFGDQLQVGLGSSLAHALLGCASSAAVGTGCAGGAIGAATSALISPWIEQSLLAGTPEGQR
jgi:hypothetical protein